MFHFFSFCLYFLSPPYNNAISSHAPLLTACVCVRLDVSRYAFILEHLTHWVFWPVTIHN